MGKREEVFGLVDDGMTTKQISAELDMPISTVRYYRENRKDGQTSRISEHRRRIKRKAIDYSGGSCLRCGYHKCDGALTFHHLDPSKKENIIAGGRTYGWDKIKEEVDKCVMLCHNCHVEVHADIWQISESLIKKQREIRDCYMDKPLTHYKD